MVRVVCTHPVNPPGVAQGGGVLCSRVALDPFMFWRIRVKVVYVGLGSDLDLHMSCGKKTPARPNRFELSCSSVMETHSPDLHRS
jgi:hypothetical protein